MDKLKALLAKIKTKRSTILKTLAGIGISIGLIGAGFGLNFVVRPSTDPETGEKKTVVEINAQIELPETVTTTELNDQGEIVETESYPFVESVDGGQFLDIEASEYHELGEIETVDTSSPEAFKRSTLGRCIIANNYYGAQCVSLARAFWYSYAGRDVSTCGTGLAKGMMNCPDQNAGSEFKTIWSPNEIIAGTWIVTGGSYTGHVCMALGPVVNGYVTCLGENQGGKSCGDGIGGSATNIINLSVKDFLGGYIPKAYIPAPEPAPTPEVLPDTSH